VTVSVSDARKLADNFGRNEIANWDKWGCKAMEDDSLHLQGHFVFTYPPTSMGEDGKPVRLGGNWPIVVKQSNGECRFVRGRGEYATMRKLQA
jgi:hypothetical protein